MKQLKSYFIAVSFILILSSCIPHDEVVKSSQTDVIQNHGQKNIIYKDPHITFFPLLPKESNKKDSIIDLSLEISPSETRSKTYLPSRCIGERLPQIQEECAAYTKLYKDFLQKHSLPDTYDSSKKRASFISEIRATGNSINIKYAVGIHTIDSISEPFIASWYTKNYSFGKGDFVKQSKNIGWLGEDTTTLTVPILSEDKHVIMTNTVTALGLGSTYAQTIFEDIPFNFESGSILSISLNGKETSNITLNSLILRIPYMNNWKGGLLKSKSGSYSILDIRTGVNTVNEAGILYCNVDICDIHFSTGVIQDIQEIQFQY